MSDERSAGRGSPDRGTLVTVERVAPEDANARTLWAHDDTCTCGPCVKQMDRYVADTRAFVSALANSATAILRTARTTAPGMLFDQYNLYRSAVVFYDALAQANLLDVTFVTQCRLLSAAYSKGSTILMGRIIRASA